MTSADSYVFDMAAPGFDQAAVLEHLSRTGFVALRNAFPKETIDQIVERARATLAQPSIGGSHGYYMKDCAKKFYDALLLGVPAIDAVTNERIIDIVETYLGGESILAEVFIKQDLGIDDVYFPLHADFQAGLKMGNGMVISQDVMQSPMAVGTMLYLHDTREGAFCYSAGSHHLAASNGHLLDTYPESLRNDITAKTVRVEGRRGDIVLFDDRGFHGPQQPVKTARTVLLFDHFKVDTFGRFTKAPLPVLLNDLGHLNERQLRFLGLGAAAMVPHDKHHIHMYSRTRTYPLMSRLFEAFFALDRLKRKLRTGLRGHKKNYLPATYTTPAAPGQAEPPSSEPSD